jgi:hypothetical protein
MLKEIKCEIVNLNEINYDRSQCQLYDEHDDGTIS